MRSYDCPNCGAAVPFDSGIAVFSTCPFCLSMVVRNDVNVEAIGKQAQLPPDISPIQIGTHGSYQGHRFVVIGRVRIGYQEGSWNEWCVDYGGNRWGWLAEAQGQFMASFEIEVPFSVESRLSPEFDAKDASPDGWSPIATANLRSVEDLLKKVRLLGEIYQVKDIKNCHIIGSEGQLPFSAPPGRVSHSIDFVGDGHRFANLESSPTGERLFVGHFLSFEDLKLDNLRNLPGWNSSLTEKIVGQSVALGCPACGAAVELRAPGQTMMAVCGACATQIDTANPQWTRIKTAESNKTYKPLIPLGRRGKVDDQEFECIGFLKRKGGYGSIWDEYLCFNPFHGFRWLVHYQGHWSWITPLTDTIRTGDGETRYNDRDYRLFASEEAQVVFVMGEFYWRVGVGDRSHLQDYVSPPFILSTESERSTKDVSASHGQYLDPDSIRNAFGQDLTLKSPEGVYLNQPNPHEEKYRSIRRIWGIATLLFLLLQLMAWGYSRNATALSTDIQFKTGQTNGTIWSTPFVIDGSPRSVKIETSTSSLNNDWVGLDVKLVHTNRGPVGASAHSLAYWSGNDDGGWVTDKTRESSMITDLPEGSYQLAVDPVASTPGRDISVRIRVIKNVFSASNIFLGLILLSVYPLYLKLRTHAFERKRWYQSDFSPYTPVAEMLETNSDD